MPSSSEVLRREELVRVRAHQEGAVRPVAHEALVVEGLVEEDVDHGQGQGAVVMADRGHDPHPGVTVAPPRERIAVGADVVGIGHLGHQ